MIKLEKFAIEIYRCSMPTLLYGVQYDHSSKTFNRCVLIRLYILYIYSNYYPAITSNGNLIYSFGKGCFAKINRWIRYADVFSFLYVYTVRTYWRSGKHEKCKLRQFVTISCGLGSFDSLDDIRLLSNISVAQGGSVWG